MAKYMYCGPGIQTLVDGDFIIPPGYRLGYCGRPTRRTATIVKIKREVRGKIEVQSLHRHIMGMKKRDGKDIDHINRDQLDNRKCNLRVCTREQNQHNNSGSGCRFMPNLGKWGARVTYKKKEVYLGLHLTRNDAIRAANAWKIANWGEFANPYPLDPEPSESAS